MLSIVSAAYNEAESLPALHAEIRQQLPDWEWVVVDDASTDGTFDVVRSLGDRRVLGLRLKRRVGSHAALLCGLRHARGSRLAVLAADGQDPPSLLNELHGPLAWGTRPANGLSRLFWLGLGMRPADLFAADRSVVEQLGEIHGNLFASLARLPVPQSYTPYVKRPRRRGRSGWSLGRKLLLLADSWLGFGPWPGAPWYRKLRHSPVPEVAAVTFQHENSPSSYFSAALRRLSMESYPWNGANDQWTPPGSSPRIAAPTAPPPGAPAERTATRTQR